MDGAGRRSRVLALADALVERGMASELAGGVAGLLLRRLPVAFAGGLGLLSHELESRGFGPALARETARTLVALAWLDRGFSLDATVHGLRRHGTTHAEALGAALEASQLKRRLPAVADRGELDGVLLGIGLVALAVGAVACTAAILLAG